jgi:Spy/CpxP family protein refolding chaperone
MRKTLVAMGLALAVAGPAVAQRPGRGGPDGRLLKGIELTEGQRTQIAQLHKTQRDAMESRRETAKKEVDDMRDARKRRDTAAVRAQIAKRNQMREQERAQQIAAIRNILTAEQRVQFDKNVVELQQREAERVAKFGERGQRREWGKRGQKTDRPVRDFGRGR